MTQDNPFFGLNMLPIFLEMIEAKLEIAENQLSSLVDIKNLADNYGSSAKSMGRWWLLKSTKLVIERYLQAIPVNLTQFMFSIKTE